jgi:hypothetical protein
VDVEPVGALGDHDDPLELRGAAVLGVHHPILQVRERVIARHPGHVPRFLDAVAADHEQEEIATVLIGRERGRRDLRVDRRRHRTRCVGGGPVQRDDDCQVDCLTGAGDRGQRSRGVIVARIVPLIARIVVA